MGRRLKSRKNLLLIGSKHAHLLIQERRIPALLRGDASEQPCEVINEETGAQRGDVI